MMGRARVFKLAWNKEIGDGQAEVDIAWEFGAGHSDCP